ncbi:hypothetical protein Poli38472_011845 [Pythium oligandrum]|uniref:Uncharacterized protein n=1 Tax=Pythium oligandrum TaxID=41045 RepID=A0A8K1C961_PYTOL|nr:hypothetical protein Poli38472_011845 [Pythium oligandrum]|eukprot:TMW58257.1 hypothetical protein Poli38472_011845 [Pythium oligandrum]
MTTMTTTRESDPIATPIDELAAALARVEESDFEALVSSVTLSSASSMSSSSSPNPNVPTSTSSWSLASEKEPIDAKKRKYTKKEELQYLRGTVKQLEARLAILQNGSSSRAGTTRCTPQTLSSSSSALDKMWARIAERQFQEREESERQNVHLRALVEEQLRLIQGLERLLSRKRSKNMSWSSGLPSRTFLDPLDDPVIEMNMDESIDDMLRAIDTILVDSRYNLNVDEPFLETGFTVDMSNLPTLETLDARWFPCSYQAAADALWGVWSSSEKSSLHTTHSLVVHATEDRICRVLDGEFNLHVCTVPFRAKLIARRIVQADRIIILSIMLIDPIEKNGETHSGVYFRERGWAIFHTPPTASNIPSDVPVACRQNYILTTPELLTPGDVNAVGQLTNSLVHMTTLRLNRNNQCLENRLLARIDKLRYKKLESSERENARLRGLVEDQLRLIRGLERMLMKKRTKVMLWYAGRGPRSVAGEFVDPMEDPELEKEMERGVEDMLGDVDRIFADPRYTTDWEEPLHLAGFTANENDLPIVETLDARLFPFPYEAAADTLWAIWTNTNKPTLHNFHRFDVEATDVRVRRVIEGEFNFKGRQVPFRAKLIARRLVHADRIVIPAMLLIDPMHMNGEKHSGVFLRERAWNVFHAAPKDENIPSDIPVACRKSYSLTTPKLFDCDDSHTVGRLTNSLICTTSMRLSMNNEAMEDRLVASFDKLGLSD